MHLHYLLFFALICCSLGCREEEPDPLAFIVTDADFGYANSTTYDLISAEDAIEHLVGVGETIVFCHCPGKYPSL